MKNFLTKPFNRILPLLLTPLIAVCLTPLAQAHPAAETTSGTTFAVIGDYGDPGHGQGLSSEGAVATMVAGWNPDFIITVGDNNYVEKSNYGFDSAVGAFYCQYLIPFNGSSSLTNQAGFPCVQNKFLSGESNFYPTPGNHDCHGNDSSAYDAYQEYFTPAPGKTPINNISHYRFTRGPVNFFALNSNCTNGGERCPDTCGPSTCTSPDGLTQEQFLSQNLRASTTEWNVVYFHHALFSSSRHPSCTAMDFVFDTIVAKGAQDNTIVLSGHDHNYERVSVEQGGKTILFIVNGVGGHSNSDSCCANPIQAPTDNSTVTGDNCFNSAYGALRMWASQSKLLVSFYTVGSPAMPQDECRLGRGTAPSCINFPPGRSGWNSCRLSRTETQTSLLEADDVLRVPSSPLCLSQPVAAR